MSSIDRFRSGVLGVMLMALGMAATANGADLVVSWGPSASFVTANRALVGAGWTAEQIGDWDGDSSSDDCRRYIPFSESAALNPSEAEYTGSGLTSLTFYGGVHYTILNATTFTQNPNGVAYNGVDNTAPADYLHTSSANTSATLYKGVNALYLWKKANFIVGSGWANAALDSTCSLTLGLRDCSPGTPGVTVRLLVKNAGRFYASNSNKTGATGALTVGNPATETWSEIVTNSSATDLRLWAPDGTYSTRIFNNVEAVGYYVSGGATANAPKASITNFQVYAVEAVANAAPVIDQGASVNASAMDEDGAPAVWAGPTLTATDANGDALTWTNSTTPAHGTVAVSGTGTNPVTWAAFAYTPAANWNGSDSFVVKASDNKGGEATITVNVTVNPRNDAPNNTAVPSVSGIHQIGQTLTANNGTWNDAADTNVSGSSTLALAYQWQRADDGAGLNAADIANETNATFVLTGADVGTYVRVRETCTDTGVGTPGTTNASADSVLWTLVTAVNSAPVIDQGDTVSASAMDEDGTPTAWSAPVLTATDADGDSLTWTNQTQPAHGTVAVSGTGTNPVAWVAFTYTPNGNWNGTDSFVVAVSDGALTDTLTVQVPVNPRNDPPVNTAAPTVSGLHQVGQVVTKNAGAWNDAIDTNASGSSILTLSCQWQHADDGAGLNAADIANATNATYTLVSGDAGKYVRVQETCTDDGVGLPSSTSVAAASGWTYAQRTPLTFTAVTSGRFNASDGDTWGVGLGVYPNTPGDTANIPSWTVTATNAGEVAGNITVNLSGTGILQLDKPAAGRPQVVHSNATVNVYTGATFRVNDVNVRVRCSTTLNGGTLALKGSGATDSAYDDGVLNVLSDSLVGPVAFGAAMGDLTCKVTGSGKLTVTNSPSSGLVDFSAGSTWSGDWDLTAGLLSIGLTANTAARSVPRGLRIAAGAEVESVNQTFPGTITGSGTYSLYRSSLLTIGNGTGGTVSPGDDGVNNGVGMIAVSNYSSTAGNNSPGVRFVSNSTYRVNIAGTAAAQYDRMTVTPSGAYVGTGRVDVVAGAVLDITLWTPPGAATLDATIIDCPGGVSGEFSGRFTTTNWHNIAGWKDLAVTVIDNDLHVSGFMECGGTIFTVR